MADQGQGGGSWWTTLPGVLTGLAGLIGAVATLLTALEKVHLPFFGGKGGTTTDVTPDPPKPPPAQDTPTQAGSAVRVEGLEVAVVALRRARGGAGLDLAYRVAHDLGYAPHDPLDFVRLMRDGAAIAPVQASAPARDLPPNSRQEFQVRFAIAPMPAPGPVLLRFGAERHLMVSAQLSD